MAVAMRVVVRMVVAVVSVAVPVVAMMVRVLFAFRARLSIIGCHPATSSFVTFMVLRSNTLPQIFFRTTLQPANERRKPSDKMAPR